MLYRDLHVSELKPTRKYDLGLQSSEQTEDLLRAVDCVLVVTDHAQVDYDLVSRSSELVVDTRNAVPRGRGNVVQA